MRVEVKAKLLISNDNLANPQDIVFSSGDQSKIDSTTFSEADSKLVDLPASTTDQQVNLDNIASAVVIMAYTTADTCKITLVPTGSVKADCSPMKLLAGYPLVIGSDIAEIYLSNTSSSTAIKVRVGIAGN